HRSIWAAYLDCPGNRRGGPNHGFPGEDLAFRLSDRPPALGARGEMPDHHLLSGLVGLGRAGDGLEEGLALEREQTPWGLGGHGGGAHAIAQQGDLAESFAGSDCPDVLAAHRYIESPAVHEVEQ